MGEAEKSSKVIVGHGKVVVVSGEEELLVNDWRVRWPRRRGRKRDNIRGNRKLVTVTLMFRFTDEFTL